MFCHVNFEALCYVLYKAIIEYNEVVFLKLQFFVLDIIHIMQIYIHSHYFTMPLSNFHKILLHSFCYKLVKKSTLIISSCVYNFYFLKKNYVAVYSFKKAIKHNSKNIKKFTLFTNDQYLQKLKLMLQLTAPFLSQRALLKYEHFYTEQH